MTSSAAAAPGPQDSSVTPRSTYHHGDLRRALLEAGTELARDVGVHVLHGDTELPLWGSASIGSVPLLEWTGAGGAGPLTAEVRESITREVVESAYRIIEGKGATNYAVALAGSRIIEAIVKDEGRVLPVSSLLDDFHGISDVCLSVPAIVHAGGVGARVEVPMTDGELAGLRSSAEAVRATARRFGF